MAAEIKLTKLDESPWGFRLTGGRDFGTPLTIIKVGVHTVAEQAGLKVGDILIRINNEATQPLTHRETQEIIRQSGNVITFSVLRGSLNLPEDVIERLTPLPLAEFALPEDQDDVNQGSSEVSAQDQLPGGKTQSPDPSDQLTPKIIILGTVNPNIELIPIKDLDPEQLQELGLDPLPEDFLEKALRDPSPLPQVRPNLEGAAPTPDILETLEQLGLPEIIHEIEKMKQEEIRLPCPGEEPVFVEYTEPQYYQQEGLDSTSTQLAGVELVANKQDFDEIMMGKAEVIEGTHAIGVDFKKYEPQADFLKKSQVFQTLQEEKPTEKGKHQKPEIKEKRWTTFLEKPLRPRIKPRARPARAETETKDLGVVDEPSITPEPQSHGLYEIPPEEEFEALVRVPTPAEPETPAQQNFQTEETELQEDGTEGDRQHLLEEQHNLQQQLDKEKEFAAELVGEEKSDIELQLEEIQKQLEAIQQLPFEIQQHLSLVQEQLSKIVQHRMEEQQGVHEHQLPPPAPRPSVIDMPAVIPEVLEEIQETSQVEETSGLQGPEDNQQPLETAPAEEQKKEFKLRAEEDAPILPPPKKERPRKKRPFMGLGPAPRPLILPGGRKWRTPKDAYNDEFIAETLSAQAEIITGTTLGVNFRKYEPKHPSLEHLRESNVYKMIHDLEDPDILRRGLADRPEIVPALQDYAQQSAPAAI